MTATSALTLSAVTTTCDTQATTDEVEQLASGNTSLRYDAASGTFVYNWKTPKAPGTCYRVTAMAADGSSVTALFKLK